MVKRYCVVCDAIRSEMKIVDTVVAMLEIYYKKYNCSGGSLHIVVDDGNLDDNNIEYCIEWANNENDVAGFIIGTLLLKMNMRQRKNVYSKYDEYK